MKKIKKTFRQYKYYAISLLKKNNKKSRFFVFAQGRTGSTLLTDLLDSHSQIFCHEEIFGDHNIGPILFPSRYTDGFAKSVDSSIYGFHVKVYQLKNNTNIKNISKWLKSMELSGWKIIYLWRRNLLRHAISNIKARKTNMYHSREKGSKRRKIDVNLDEVESKIKGRKEWRKTEKKCLNNVDYIDIVYEDDLIGEDSQIQACYRIFDFLGIKREKVRSRLDKVTPNRLEDVIRNYEAVVERLRGTEYEKHLTS